MSQIDELLENAERKEIHDDHLWTGTTLKEVYDTFGKWLHIPDKNLLDLCLAVALSRKMSGTPLWVIIVGTSGDGKSELVMSFNNPERSMILHELTPSTLVSGYKEGKERFDLAPELNGKLVLFPDMAQLLHLHPNDKAKVWAQLRELYDGRAGRRTGSSNTPSYENLRVTMLACSTPSIDSQILVFTHLGTRELLYRTDLSQKSDNVKLMDKVLENEKNEDLMRLELKDVVSRFLSTKKVMEDKIPKAVMEKIKAMVTYLRFMRATADTDAYTGELLGAVYPEKPTRALKQLVRLFQCLKSLDMNYSDARALEVLSHVVRSSVLPMRESIMALLFDVGEKLSTSQIANRIRIGKKPAFRQLNILWNMRLVEREEDDFDQRHTCSWCISKEGIAVYSWLNPEPSPKNNKYA